MPDCADAVSRRDRGIGRGGKVLERDSPDVFRPAGGTRVDMGRADRGSSGESGEAGDNILGCGRGRRVGEDVNGFEVASNGSGTVERGENDGGFGAADIIDVRRITAGSEGSPLGEPFCGMDGSRLVTFGGDSSGGGGIELVPFTTPGSGGVGRVGR